ncbi:MAG: hypothetical protein AAF416_20775 [Pseudomonadota bacterium]
MRRAFAALLGIATCGVAQAETVLIDTERLPAREVYDVALLTPLALTPNGTPAVVLLSLDAGDVVPPHTASGGLRLLTVLSGEMSWGDGAAIAEEQEVVHGPGSILALPADASHWLAARSGPVRLQLILLDDEIPTPDLQEQLQ